MKIESAENLRIGNWVWLRINGEKPRFKIVTLEDIINIEQGKENYEYSYIFLDEYWLGELCLDEKEKGFWTRGLQGSDIVIHEFKETYGLGVRLWIVRFSTDSRIKEGVGEFKYVDFTVIKTVNDLQNTYRSLFSCEIYEDDEYVMYKNLGMDCSDFYTVDKKFLKYSSR